MASELVILIVGGILILLAVADGISSLGLMSVKFRVPMAIMGILLIIYGGYSFGNVGLPGPIEKAYAENRAEIIFPIKNVQVISPVEGDAVKCRILTMGVYPESQQKDIWVLLKPTDNKYYPQSDHTNTSFKLNGEWQVITRFGGDKNEAYEIVVYETERAASEFFSKTIQQWKDALSYPGLTESELPQGITEVDRITVSLQDNCRGVH